MYGDRRTGELSAAVAGDCALAWRDPNESYFVIYKVYYDASGSQADLESKVLTVAGLLSTETKWLQFETEWEGLLADFGYETFSMADYVQEGKKVESAEDADRRIAFRQDYQAQSKRYLRLRRHP